MCPWFSSLLQTTPNNALRFCAQVVDPESGTLVRTKPRVERTRSLVTGGAGFVGSHLCDYLVQRGDHVRPASLLRCIATYCSAVCCLISYFELRCCAWLRCCLVCRRSFASITSSLARAKTSPISWRSPISSLSVTMWSIQSCWRSTRSTTWLAQRRLCTTSTSPCIVDLRSVHLPRALQSCCGYYMSVMSVISCSEWVLGCADTTRSRQPRQASSVQ